MSRLFFGAIVVLSLVSTPDSVALGQETLGDIINNNGNRRRNEVDAYREEKQREMDRFRHNSAVLENSINQSMRQLQSHLESQQRYPQGQYQQRRPQYDDRGYQYRQPRRDYYTRPNNQGPGYYSDPPVAPRTYSNLPIVIRCPKYSEGRIRYSLISRSGKVHPYVISPGQKQELRETTDWTIRFDDGSGAGEKSFRLRGGQSYAFRNGSDGRLAFYMDRD